MSIKFSNRGMPALMAAALHSLVLGALLWSYARIKGQIVAFPSGQTLYALAIGLLFGLEFLFVYWGLTFTPASRSLIFLYTQAFWVARRDCKALLLHYLLSVSPKNPIPHIVLLHGMLKSSGEKAS